VRILEVELPTGALAQQRDFYVRALGLGLLEDEGERFAVRAGGTRLSFVASGDDPTSQHFAFNIPENQLTAARRWLAQRAPMIPGPHGEQELDFSSWNADAVYCLDPAGNVVELIARHSLPNAADAPFGPRALLEVSEVGVPVSDVPAAVAFLEEPVGIPLWDGDRRGFAAMGDDVGLFIVVPQGRPWFPTDRPAHTPPLAIVISGSTPARYDATPLGLALEARPAP
jgi:catechol-2,3-dioxygenase